MTPIKVIKSWHCATCSPSLCQPIHSPSSSPAHISAHLAPLHAIIRCTTSALLPSPHLSLMGTSSSSLCHVFPVPLLLPRPLKETWSLKLVKCSTPETLKRPSVQLIDGYRGRQQRLGPARERGELERERGCKPVPDEGRDNCFVLLGAPSSVWRELKWHATHGFRM